MKSSYQPFFVILCFLLAFGASYLVTCLVEQLRVTHLGMTDPKYREQRMMILPIVVGICFGGVGMWGMHLVGTASLMLQDGDGHNVPIKFNTGITLLSLVLVLTTSTIGVLIATGDPLFAKTKKDIIEVFISHTAGMSMAQAKNITAFQIVKIISTRSLWRLILGGFIAGSGVVSMHYVGMMAMEFQGTISWNAGVVAATVLIACIACTVAFWIIFRLLSIFPHYESLRMLSTFAMGVAVSGVHYLGMMAAQFQTSTDLYGSNVGTATMNTTESVIGPLAVGLCVLWCINQYILMDLRSMVHTNENSIIQGMSSKKSKVTRNRAMSLNNSQNRSLSSRFVSGAGTGSTSVLKNNMVSPIECDGIQSKLTLISPATPVGKSIGEENC